MKNFSKNTTFEKALILLAHPFSLAAILLLLVNDHLLRRLWPSWWTGKLGDFAWLAFIPFALAALLSWVIPGSAKERDRRTAWLSFGGTGLVFALAKTSPPFHGWLASSLEQVSGIPIITRLDPSDLIALPVLLIGWRLWQAQSEVSSLIRISKSTSQFGFMTTRKGRVIGWITLPLAALLTLANAAAPDPGITCLSIDNGTVRAQSTYFAYVSEDGGLTWKDAGANFGTCTEYGSSRFDWKTLEAQQTGFVFRYRSDQPVEISQDGGQTWQAAPRPQTSTEAERSYLSKTKSGNPYVLPGPLAAIEDPGTGNVIFGMGHDGVLVYTRSGDWITAGVGEYRRPDNFPTPESLAVLLGGEMLLAVGAGLIIFCTLALIWLRATPRIIVLVFGAIAWLGVILVLPPALNSSYNAIASGMGLLASGLFLVPLAIENIFQLARRAASRLPGLFGLALAGIILFFLPFLLWAFNALPGYTLTFIFALILVAAVIAAGFWYFRAQARPNAQADTTD